MKVSAVAALFWAMLGCGGFAACGGSTQATPGDGDSGTPVTDDDSGDGTDGPDAGDASVDSAPPVFADDGTATRVTCVSTYGKGITPVHGRLDGVLTSIVGPTGQRCNNDDTHLHLQVTMGGGVYDIAVNLDGLEGEIDGPMPGDPYADGWHPGLLDYVTDLNVHSTDINLTGEDAIRARLLYELTNVNHISVFGTGYPTNDGAHDIHRETPDSDGALVLDPMGAKPHIIVFRFATDSF